MADFGISIVEMLVETIGSEIIKHVCDTWGYKSQLEELRKTVSTIRMLLLDADNKREELSNVEQEYIRELKDAVYDADDLFDTICTQAKLNQLTSLKKVDKFLAKEMAMLSKLPHLKSLALKSLQNLEYMENTSNSSSSSSSSDTESATKLATFFPSLENLDFNDLPKLKGWWKGEPSVAGDHSLKRRFRFPRLCHLQILRCPNLTSFPPCPSVRTMKLHETNEKLQIIVKTTGKAGEEDNTAVGAGAGAGTSRDDYDNDNANVKLWDLRIDHVSHLKSIATNCLINLEIKMIRGQGRGHGEVENQSEVEFEVAEAFQRCASSLRSLIIEEINNYCMRILCRGGRGLENFTALKSLTLKNVYKHHDHDDDDDSNSMLWKSFPKNLRSLELFSYSFKNLPKGIQYLTSLESFTIENCEKMKELPEWISCLSSLRYLGIARCPALKSLPEGMRNLTSLQRLQIFFCSDLKKRCKEPDGEDRPKIQHIPKIILN